MVSRTNGTTLPVREPSGLLSLSLAAKCPTALSQMIPTGRTCSISSHERDVLGS